MPSIGHLFSATLLAASLALPVAVATEPTAPAATVQAAPPARRCMTYDNVMEKVKGTPPTVDLQGAELEAFNANYKQLTGSEAPAGVTRIMVWGEVYDGTSERQVLFVAFEGDCVGSAAFIPAKDFLTILNGRRA